MDDVIEDIQEVSAADIQELLGTGLNKSEVAEKLGLGSHQKVTQILKAAERAKNKKQTMNGVIVKGELVDGDEQAASLFAETYVQEGAEYNGKATLAVLTASEYDTYSAANGRYRGRKEGKKTVCTIEELRALINSKYTPKMIMQKHGLSAEEFKQLVWALSKSELRDKPLRFSIEQDMIEKG